jgi:cyclopropane-fatty-acyl-phospholipid synthase
LYGKVFFNQASNQMVLVGFRSLIAIKTIIEVNGCLAVLSQIVGYFWILRIGDDMSALPKTEDKFVDISLAFVQDILKDYHPRDFAVRFWDGSVWEAEAGQPTRFTIVLNHPGALRKMFLPPTELAMGEAYIFQDFDIEGDLDAVFKLGDEIMDKRRGVIENLRNAARLLRLPSTRPAQNGGRGPAHLSGEQHSRERDKAAVTYHYNVSNDFYALWLDKNMVYSCGYFADPHEDLDTAQERKLDYLCRKLRLKPGEKLLDIGCGWGGLIRHAAQHYGVEALGITLSQPQADLANQRIREAGLEDRCRAEVRDYRDLNPREMQFDKLASVGMFEHVGSKMLLTYFQQAWDLLRPGGVFLNHGIAADKYFIVREPSFVLHYVFPDGELVPLSTTIKVAEEVGFEVRDVESLREHYALTLRHWARRLAENEAKAIELVGSVTYRVWRIHHVGAAYGFDTRRNNLYQVLMVKPDHFETRLPLTRADWYGRKP